MSADISKHCSRCAACQSRRSPVPRPQAPLISISPDRPFEIVAVDITELPLSTKGNRYVLVMMDLYTKFVNLYPLKDQTAISVAGCIFNHYIPQHGVLDALHSDQGRQFESDLIQNLCKLLGIKKLCTSPYHAQCDGAVERFNRTLKDELAKYLFESGREWDEHLPHVALAYNTINHSSTGFTPFFLVHGREARVPLDVLFQDGTSVTSATSGTPAAFANSLRHRLSSAYRSATAYRDKAQGQQRHYYDRHVMYTPYKAGDLVLIDDPANKHNKLRPRWVGPYAVLHSIAPLGSLTPVDFAVRDTSKPHAKTKVIHYNRMKPYITEHSQTHTPSSPQLTAKPNTLNTLSGLLPPHVTPIAPGPPAGPPRPRLLPAHQPLPQYGPLPVSKDNARDICPAPSLVQPPQMPPSMVVGVPAGSPVSPVTQSSTPHERPRLRRMPAYLKDFQLY